MEDALMIIQKGTYSVPCWLAEHNYIGVFENMAYILS